MDSKSSSCGSRCLLLVLVLKIHGLSQLHLFVRFISGRVDCQGLGEVRLLGSALWARYHLGVVGEKIEWLLGMAHQLTTCVALQKNYGMVG